MDIKLRQSAEERLATGTAPATRAAPVGTNALALLYRLASDPETAGDAQKLLHELQVHQVEIDLQHEQVEQERRQLAQDLTACSALFELAPFAYLSLDAEGRVMAANRLAADWLAPATGPRPAWAGHRIEDLLAPECHAAVHGMLAALNKTTDTNKGGIASAGTGAGRQAFAVQARASGARAHAVATAMPVGARVLMALVPAGLGR